MSKADPSLHGGGPEDSAQSFEPFRLHPARQQRLDGGNTVRLASSTMENLVALVERPGETVMCRGSRVGDDGERSAVLVVLPAAEPPSPSSLDRLAHEYRLKDELDRDWAVRPLELIREGRRTVLVLEDPGGEPLERLLGGPLEIDRFLRLAIDISAAVGKLHRRGLLHKDIKPANILVNCVDTPNDMGAEPMVDPRC
jgi:serine/threonine protein kinase